MVAPGSAPAQRQTPVKGKMKLRRNELKTVYSIQKSHNGEHEIYVPKENGELFERTTSLDRHMISFKTRTGAEKFLIKQGAKPEEIQ